MNIQRWASGGSGQKAGKGEIMRKKVLAIVALSAAMSAAMSVVHADVGLQTWDFKYTGANEVGNGWKSDWTLAGSFSGRDLNNDGQLDLGELLSFTLRGREFVPCSQTEYTRCGMIDFLLNPGGNLRFHATRTSSDPEGWYGSFESYSSFGGEYLDYYNPAQNFVTDYRITDDTIVSVMQVSGPGIPPAVPEPARPFMFAAGLALLGALFADMSKQSGISLLLNLSEFLRKRRQGHTQHIARETVAIIGTGRMAK